MLIPAMIVLDDLASKAEGREEVLSQDSVRESESYV